jgi:hypothetical protein
VDDFNGVVSAMERLACVPSSCERIAIRTGEGDHMEPSVRMEAA